MADVLIVGGGPAGSTAARILARAGQRVDLLEAARFPRTKLCAGWVTPDVWRTLELDPTTYPKTIQPFSAASLAVGTQRHECHWPSPVSYGIIRREFDAYLLDRAQRAGARVHQGTRVKQVARATDRVVITTDSGCTFAGSRIIGAGGHLCPVARAFGGVSGDEAVVITRESETRLDAGLLRCLTDSYGTPELFAEEDFMGYGWYFTKGDFLNIGLGCVGPRHNIRRRCDALLARLRRDGRLPPDLEIEPFRGHAYAIRGNAPRTVAGDDFALLGDAAGLARALSGEGIGPAVESATMLARRLIENPSGFAPPYRADLAARFGNGTPSLAARLSSKMPPWLLQSAARQACSNSWVRQRLIFEGAFGMEPSVEEGST